MPGLHLFLGLNFIFIYSLFYFLFFIPCFIQRPNLNEDKEKRTQQYDKEYESPTLVGELDRHFIPERKTLDKDKR